MSVPQRTPPGLQAFALMLLLCALWGFQQVAIKMAATAISPIAQAGLRSLLALSLLVVWARWRRIPLLRADGCLRPGLFAGLLFTLEFVCIYVGLEYTSAGRMIVFLYTAPCFTVLGLHLRVAGEQLQLRHVLGVLLAFVGVAVGFAGNNAMNAHAWIGDMLGILAAVGWAATTVLVRASPLAHIPATRVLFFQLATSAAVLPLVAAVAGEHGITALTPPLVLALAYQGVVVAFASYLAWFWLLTRYLAGRLIVFSFLTPLFGVASGMVFLGERLTASFALAAACVAGGIVLVNWPDRRTS